MLLTCVKNGQGWKVKEASMYQGDSVAVGNRDGDGGSGNLVVGVGRLD